MAFKTTRWTMVYAARGSESPESRQALESLCATYWRPLYQFARRRGLNEDEAREMTQEFFAQLLERHSLNRLDRSRGKFRSFLLACFTNMMNNEWDRQSAKKRQPSGPLIPFEESDGHVHVDTSAQSKMSPEIIFDREWALTIVRESLESLERQYRDEGKGAIFDTLKPYLTISADREGYVDLATELGVSHSGAKVAVHRIRKRYRKEIRRCITETVHTPDEIDEEINYLMDVLAHGGSADN